MRKWKNERIGETKLLLLKLGIVTFMLLQFGIMELINLIGSIFTIEQWAMIGWIAGAVYSAFLIFYGKVRAGKLTLDDYNFGFIVNFGINTIIGVMASLVVFVTWTIPVGAWWFVIIVAFGASAGIDQELIKTALDKIGVYAKVAEKFSLVWN